jgi:hypothetical protein
MTRPSITTLQDAGQAVVAAVKGASLSGGAFFGAFGMGIDLDSDEFS